MWPAGGTIYIIWIHILLLLEAWLNSEMSWDKSFGYIIVDLHNNRWLKKMLCIWPPGEDFQNQTDLTTPGLLCPIVSRMIADESELGIIMW